MPDARFETRHDLEFSPDVVAFGFAGRVLDDAACGLIDEKLLASIEEATRGKKPSFVVLDFRAVEDLSSAALAKLIMLQKRLGGAGWRLVVLGLSPEFLGAFSQTITHVADERDLHRLLGQTDASPCPSPDQGHLEFTPEEINAMNAAGITLQDAIRAIERL